MHYDDFTVSMICAAFILGPIAALIVGSQDAAEARAIADGSFVVLFVLLLIACVRFAAGRDGDLGGPGLVILFLALIASIGVGCRIARSRPTGRRSNGREGEIKAQPWDEELA